MSINFNDPMNAEVIAEIKKRMEVSAMDEKQALIDGPFIRQKDMKAIANAAGQPAIVELHSIGEVVEMRDGTRYEVTPKGWQKISSGI